MQESEPLIYDSEFLPNVQIAVVLEENPQYKDLKPLFDEYGYGFMVPGKNLVIIDGEQFIDNFSSDVLKFIDIDKIFKPIESTKKSAKSDAAVILEAYNWLSKKDNNVMKSISQSKEKSPEIIARISNSTH